MPRDEADDDRGEAGAHDDRGCPRRPKGHRCPHAHTTRPVPRRPRGEPPPEGIDADRPKGGHDSHPRRPRGEGIGPAQTEGHRCPPTTEGIDAQPTTTEREGIDAVPTTTEGGGHRGRPRPKGIDAHVTTKGPRHDRKGGHRCAHDDRGGRAWAGPDRRASMPTHVTTRGGPTAEDAHSGCPQQGIDAHTTRCPGGGPPCGGMDAEGRVQGDGNPKGPLTTPRQGGGPR